jgi:hypothetical protein
MNLASCQWDNGLDVACRNQKQSCQQHISFSPDNHGFLLDLYHAFGCMLVANPGYHLNIYDSEWFFPRLADYADRGIATFLTNKIKDEARKFKLDSVTEEHTAHGVRAGAADDMSLSSCYLFSKSYIAQAGKVLTGYSHPEQDVTLPSLDFLQPIALESLVQHMFTDPQGTAQAFL